MKLEEIIASYNTEPDLVNTFEQIKNRFRATGLNMENISVALVTIMMEIGKIKNLKPYERKHMTISILNNFVEDICPGDDTPLELVLKGMIPNLIDQINEIKLPTNCFPCIKM
jgi:hypothetical protein